MTCTIFKKKDAAAVAKLDVCFSERGKPHGAASDLGERTRLRKMKLTGPFQAFLYFSRDRIGDRKMDVEMSVYADDHL